MTVYIVCYSTDSTLLGLSILNSHPSTSFRWFSWGDLWIRPLWRQPGWQPEEHSFLMLFGSGGDHRRPLLRTDSLRGLSSVSLSVCQVNPALVVLRCIRGNSSFLRFGSFVDQMLFLLYAYSVNLFALSICFHSLRSSFCASPLPTASALFALFYILSFEFSLPLSVSCCYIRELCIIQTWKHIQKNTSSQ